MDTQPHRPRATPSRRLCASVLLLAGGGLFAACAEDAEASPYEQANMIRGGQLYDSYWAVEKPSAVAPTADNPWYLEAAGTQSGPVTWRCKECHGWDYKGVEGKYGSGSHFTGVAGILDRAGEPADALFRQISEGMPGTARTGFGAHLSPSDIWDLVKFVREGTLDLSAYIDDATGAPIGGDPVAGKALYEASCVVCHGADGKTLNFGDAEEPEYVGTIAAKNPWEYQHKVRFGQPGELMPSQLEEGWTMKEVIDSLSHARTLPQL